MASCNSYSLVTVLEGCSNVESCAQKQPNLVRCINDNNNRRHSRNTLHLSVFRNQTGRLKIRKRKKEKQSAQKQKADKKTESFSRVSFARPPNFSQLRSAAH